MTKPIFSHEISNVWSQFSLPPCPWRHITPGASWVPTALPSLLPEQITEAVLPWEQSEPPREVTGQLHRKDSAPKQWNRTVEIWSSLPTKCGHPGVEMATPQPSWRQTTLALARLQWEAQSTLHCPEMFISTCPSHWEGPFVMSRTSEYAGYEITEFQKHLMISHLNRMCREVSPDLYLTWKDKLNSSTVVTSAPWTGHSGAGPELSLLPLTPERFSPDLAIWLSEELMSQDWHRFATPQLCIDDLGSGECEVPIRHWDPVFSRINFYSSRAGSILSNQTHKSWEKQISKPTVCSWSWLGNWKHVTGNGVKAFIFQPWGMKRKYNSVRIAFSRASVGREIQKDLQN